MHLFFQKIRAAKKPQTTDEIGKKNPQTIDKRPQTSDKNPQTSDKNPQTIDKKPQTTDEKPSTYGQKTSNYKYETGKKKADMAVQDRRPRQQKFFSAFVSFFCQNN